MSIPRLEALAQEIRFDSDSMWVELTDGRVVGIPLAYFPRLLNATPTQRKKYIISGDGIGIHWDNLNEDISVPTLLAGTVGQTARTGKGKRSNSA